MGAVLFALLMLHYLVLASTAIGVWRFVRLAQSDPCRALQLAECVRRLFES